MLAGGEPGAAEAYEATRIAYELGKTVRAMREVGIVNAVTGRGRHTSTSAYLLALPDDDRVARLVARHQEFGRSDDDARQRALGSDQANADLVADTARFADRVLKNWAD